MTTSEGRRIKVLFADDNEDTLQVLDAAARYIGNFECRLARDGKEVETLLNEEEFDVLCLDVDMPYAYGTTIADAVRERNIPVAIIFLTGRSGREVRQTAHQTNTRIVSKPPELDELMDLIKTVAIVNYHGPERREMSINTTTYRRRATDQPFELPRGLATASHAA